VCWIDGSFSVERRGNLAEVEPYEEEEEQGDYDIDENGDIWEDEEDVEDVEDGDACGELASEDSDDSEQEHSDTVSTTGVAACRVITCATAPASHRFTASVIQPAKSFLKRLLSFDL
jgi:hypothetical protein